ncbi:MAG: TIGR00725 family protein [Thermodesulfobacteriota bacterium]
MNKGAIGVIGTGDDSRAFFDTAFEVGSLIAKAGFTLINGGLGGVMEASARGAKEAGGLTIGLLPGADKKAANPYIDVAIPTGMGDMRNALIVRGSVGLIAIGGSMGTLSEIALALKAGKPVVGIDTWDVSDEIVEATGPKEAIEKLIALTSKG